MEIIYGKTFHEVLACEPSRKFIHSALTGEKATSLRKKSISLRNGTLSNLKNMSLLSAVDIHNIQQFAIQTIYSSKLTIALSQKYQLYSTVIGNLAETIGL